jgi:hypothetical protein
MNLRIFCQRQPWDMGAVSVWIRTRPSSHEDTGSRTTALPLTFRALTKDDEGVELPPAMSLAPDAAQQLMDELWNTGLRPSEGTGSAGALAATQRHLEDMRTLVFKPKP